MVSTKNVEQQLERVGAKFRYFAKPEIKELTNILIPGETITSASNGFYHGGMALLCTTDQRMLLIDKRMWFLTLEDIRYDTITEVDYHYRLFNATSVIHTITKSLEFKSWNQGNLRKVTGIVQEHLMKLRALTQSAQQSLVQGQGQPQQQPQMAGVAGFGNIAPQSLSPAINNILMRPRVGKFTLKSLR